MLSGSYDRYRSIYAHYLKERKKGKTKLQAVHDTGDKKGASDRTVYTAIKVCSKMQ